MSPRRLAPFVLVAQVMMLSVVACDTPKRLGPDDYYEAATAALEDENYQVAIQQYNELLDQFPFDPHAEEAELRIAESHYKREAYPDAIGALSDFQRMHPMSQHLPLVYYLLGQSYMDQMVSIDRDQGAADNAHSWYRVVIDRYPASPYAGKSQEKIAECRESLAGHELYVADFYFKRGNRDAAEHRIKGLLDTYPDTEVATDALGRLVTEYTRTGETQRAELAERALDARIGRPELDGTLTLNSKAGRALLASLDARFGPSLPPGEAQPVAALEKPAGAESAPVPAAGPPPGIDGDSRALPY